MLNSSCQHFYIKGGDADICSHTRMHKRIDFHICVASINLLLSLFGPCLESQCTLCGEPEGEWAFAIPQQLLSSSSPGLLFCCFGEGGKWSGGDAVLQTLFFSLHLSKAPVRAGFQVPRRTKYTVHKDSVLLVSFNLPYCNSITAPHITNRCTVHCSVGLVDKYNSRRRLSLCT